MGKGMVLAEQPTSLYRFYDAAGKLLYIGITNSIPRRLGDHDDKKPWFIDAVKVTMEHHPSRLAALDAEKKAIKAERPKYNIVHNHGRQPAAKGPQTFAGRWSFESRASGWAWRTDLYLYPELECSSMVDDVHYLDGEGQFEEYVQYLDRKHPEWLDANAVPIVWTVRSRTGRSDLFEAAPFQGGEPPWGDFLKHFTWPVNWSTCERLDWYQLPVVNDRFPEFAEALAWTPSPMQATCPLGSILRSRSGIAAAA